ncbi:MAG: Flp pilus assembly complex ATPase component TadA [Omnitrophica bacterium]|nr:Flp pilus assembly complex ATPase component TadA [Candidatus Omnitrophota bacterium]
MTWEEKLKSLGVLGELLRDPTISDIMVNGSKQIYYERHGKKYLYDKRIKTNREVLDMIEKIYSWESKRIDKLMPFADVCLEDGSRVNAIIPPLARIGPVITIRKFYREISTPEDLIKLGTLTPLASELIENCMKGRLNILFSGGTGVGKTTTLQIYSRCIAPHERIIVIEDTPELRLMQEHLIFMETRQADENDRGEITLRDLIRNSLRMRPDRIIIGEVRGAEAIDMIQAMAVGHSGCLGVIHGNSPVDVIARLETMILMSGINMALREVRKQIASTIDLVIHQSKYTDGSRKITHITELEGMRGEEIVYHDLYAFDFEGLDKKGKVIGELKPTFRHYPNFFQEFQRLGLNLDKVFARR